MRDELLTYYESELTFIRRLAWEFAEKYPGEARDLLLRPDRSEDPHVERLIESFALLAARIHLKLDDEFPEITEALLQVLYPHYLAPVPSMSIVQFTLDPKQGKVSTGYAIGRDQLLYSKPSQDTTCRFRTCYPMTLWPIEVVAARHETPGPIGRNGQQAASAIALRLSTTGDTTFAELNVRSLRFFLSGEGHVVHALYEGLLGHCTGVQLRNPAQPDQPPIDLGADSVTEVGFGKQEGILPYSNRSHLGYRLVQEYFAFPEKFHFFDVSGLDQLHEAGFDREAELVFTLDQPPRLKQALEPANFRLGCTPIVNLFQQSAEPIRLDEAHSEYRIVPDYRRQRTLEVYSVDRVTAIHPATRETVTYQPFYSFKHTFEGRKPTAFWHASRRPSTRKDDLGTEVYLTVVDLDLKQAMPDANVLTVDVTCTNRDLPEQLPFGDPDGDLQVENVPAVKHVVCLTKPTPTQRPPLRNRAQWRLISHLSLNYLSPVESNEKSEPEALREILRLYDFSESLVVQQQIAGVLSVQSRQVARRIKVDEGTGFARGVETTIEFDDARYVGSGLYLFSSILEKFLALSVSVNSFSALVAKSRQRDVFKRWPPRHGYQALL